MSSKTETIHIKWIRSGIGFPRKQKEMVRSLGLRRLNQVVERPDTVHIRGLVAKIPHLVEVIEVPSSPAWATIPEYTIIPSEAPLKPKRSRPARVEQESEEVPEAAVSAEEHVPEKVASKEAEVSAPGKRRSKTGATASEEKGTAKTEHSKAPRRKTAGESAAKAKKSTEPTSSKKGKK